MGACYCTGAGAYFCTGGGAGPAVVWWGLGVGFRGLVGDYCFGGRGVDYNGVDNEMAKDW